MKNLVTACQYIAIAAATSAIGTGLYVTGLGKFLIDAYSIMAMHVVNLF